MSLDWTKYAVVALGSNLGNSTGLVREAIERLKLLSIDPLLVSSLWKSTPVDCPPGSGDFINAVVALRPLRSESPESLLDRLLALEREFGRRPKSVPNEARPLDLDLITFGEEERNTARLHLPHPRAQQRKFVLQPLAEILPELILPGSPWTVAQLLEKLQTPEFVTRVEAA